MSSEAQAEKSTGAVISMPSVAAVFLLLAAASYGALIWAPTERSQPLDYALRAGEMAQPRFTSCYLAA